MDITVKFTGPVEMSVYNALLRSKAILEERFKSQNLTVSQVAQEELGHLEEAIKVLNEARDKAQKRKPRKSSDTRIPAATFSETEE